MSNIEKIVQEMAKKKELKEKLFKLWKEGASEDQILDAIRNAGIEVTKQQVEEFLALLQRENTKKIASKKLNKDELDMVAAAGSGMDCVNSGADCDYRFQWCSISNTWERPKCNFSNACDEIFSWGMCWETPYDACSSAFA